MTDAEAKKKKDADRQRAYYAKNKKKVLARKKRYRAANKGQDRRRQLKVKYGITPEQHDALFAAQGFKCAVCSAEEPGSKTGWHTDHCHGTGAVRGILCHHCNLLLGNAKDNTSTLLRAAEYLKAHT